MLKAIVMTGYGINCEEETAEAFRVAGAQADIVHINDLIANPSLLKDYRIMAFPGGFSYGDDTGSGKAYANKIRSNLSEEFFSFIAGDNLVIGICNGFQIITSLGIVPGFGAPGTQSVALEHNTGNRYECGWVELKTEDSVCVFTRGIDTIRLPFAHGEGNFYAPAEVMEKLRAGKQIALRYAKAGAPAQGEYPYNPNGAMDDIAGICDATGRVFGLMPHPERYIRFTQGDLWTRERDSLVRKGQPLPEEGAGIRIFRNAVEYFK